MKTATRLLFCLAAVAMAALFLFVVLSANGLLSERNLLLRQSNADLSLGVFLCLLVAATLSGVIDVYSE